MIITILLSYLIGSFPTAYLFYKKIFNKGTGNMGAYNFLKTTNSYLKTSIILLIDVFKGVLIVILSQTLSPGLNSLIIGVVSGIIGHDYSIFVNFKGGKGLGLSIGVLLLLEPFFLVYMIMILGVLYFIFRNNVKAGLASIPFLIILYLIMNPENYPLILGVISALLIVHKDVIKILNSF